MTTRISRRRPAMPTEENTGSLEGAAPTTATTVRRTRAKPAPALSEALETIAAIPAPTRVRRVVRAVPAPAPEPGPAAVEGPLPDLTDDEKEQLTNEAIVERYERIIASYKEKAVTPKKAIRAHCIECMGGMSAEVARCTAKSCALHPFRTGANPFHKLSKLNKQNQGEDDEG